MGPLKGVRIIELQGIGPGPFCGMMLADMGAEVIRIDRTGAPGGIARAERFDLLARGRRSIRLNLKSEEGIANRSGFGKIRWPDRRVQTGRH